MWTTIIVFVYLAILGIWDVRKREVPIYWLAIGMVLLSGIGCYRCVQGELRWMEMLLGCLPGVLLLLVAWLSKKAGYADGVVLIQLGLCLGYREGLLIFGFSMLFISVISVMLLLFRKVDGDTKMPYLTFLAITFFIQQL